jgi:hypothetical protein
MGRRRASIVKMTASERESWTALDYEKSASSTLKLVVKLATNPAWIRTQGRSLFDGFGSLERCWTTLPIAPADARSGEARWSLSTCDRVSGSRVDGLTRFG